MRLALLKALCACALALLAVPAHAAGGDCATADGLGGWRAVGKPRVRAGALVTPRSRRPAYLRRRVTPVGALTLSFAYRRGGRGPQTLVRLVRSGVSVRDDGRGRLVLRVPRARMRLPGGSASAAGIRLRRESTGAAGIRLPRGSAGTAGIRLPRGSAAGRRGWRVVRLTVGGGRVSLSAAGRVRSSGGLRARLEAEIRLGDLSRERSGPFRFRRVRLASSGCGASGGRGVEAPRPAVPAPAGCACRWFAPDSFWNARLARDAALDPKSDVWVAELRRQLETADPWINTTSYSTPVYTVPADQPTVRVKLDGVTWASPLQDSWERVPIPPHARPAAGGDAHMVIWQPSSDRMWEFWATSRKDDGWHARWGGTIDRVSESPGHYTGAQARWGATATSLPLAGGLIRPEELERGRIDHALALAIPHTLIWWKWSWPAQRSDGDTDSDSAIPEGARFRLDPALDVDSLDLPRTTRIIAKAAQEYGIVLRDKSGSVSFYAEDPTPLGHNPYPALFGTWPNRLFDRFPWHRLQVLKTDMRSTSH